MSELPIHDSLSVCDVDPESLKMNRKKTAVAMKTKMADMKTYYDQVEKGDRLAQVQCGDGIRLPRQRAGALISSPDPRPHPRAGVPPSP